MSDEIRNVADPEQIASAGKKEKRRRERELEDVRFILRAPQGRRFLWSLLSRCGLFKTSYSETPHLTYFNEGRRESGLALLAELTEADESAYVAIMQEGRRKLDGE